MKNLTIYRSSAGSGKTYTLVKEYLQIALKYPMQFRQILAITFTNKATAEMKGRIIKTLGELADGNAKELAAELQSTINLNNLSIEDRSREVLSNILHQYSYFSISTIDSFFIEIVKSLAFELKLPLRFEIEIDKKYLISQACDQLINKVGSDPQLRQNLEDYINYKMEYDKGWQVKDEISKIAERIFDDDFIAEDNNVNKESYSDIILQLRKIRQAYERSMAAFGNSFAQAIKKHGYTVDNFAYKKAGVAGYLIKISNLLSPEDYQYKVHVAEAINDVEKWISKENKNDNVLKGFIDTFCHPLLQELNTFHEHHFRQYNSSVQSLKLVYVNFILSKLNEEIIQYRKENKVITLSDTNRLLLESVSSSDTPLVYEKTGNKYAYYLLDEFQDTSTIQWENIRPLISEVLANNKQALLVGDVKQSIYRWRGGNMDLLHHGVEKDFSAFSELINVKQLSLNYRSAKQIVEFNNTFFSTAPSIIEAYNESPLSIIQEAYSKDQLHQQLPGKTKEDGYVEINFLDKTMPVSKNEEGTWQEKALAMMLEQIKVLLSLDYQYSDIAIIVRTNREGNKVANFLYKNGIHQILSNESLLLSKAPQVQFVINCLRFVIDQQNMLMIKEIEWFLYEKKLEKEESLHSFFDASSKTNSKEGLFRAYRKQLKSIAALPIDEAVTFITRHFELNTIHDAFVRQLQDITLEFLEKENTSDIGSFLRWWDEMNERKDFSVIMPVSGNAIQIISIHKSKGLQFQIVIMPFADWKLKPKSGTLIWVEATDVDPFNKLNVWPVESNKNLLETVFSESYFKTIEESYIDNMNMLYVAFTRACNQLYLYVPRKKDSREKTMGDLIIDSLNTFPDINMDNNCIKFGLLTSNMNKKKAAHKPSIFNPETVDLITYPIYDWHSKLSLKSEKIFHSEQIETGLIVHDALSIIRSESDLLNAINKMVALYQLHEKDADFLHSEITSVFDICRSKKWFDGHFEVYNEREFCSSDGTLHRPDRIMIRDNNAVVIDFKTGEESNSHHHQMLRYKQLLVDCGFPFTECWLVYIPTKKLIAVN